jgi:hypothetical protein
LLVEFFKNIDFQGSYGRLYETPCLNFNGIFGTLPAEMARPTLRKIM